MTVKKKYFLCAVGMAAWLLGGCAQQPGRLETNGEAALQPTSSAPGEEPAAKAGAYGNLKLAQSGQPAQPVQAAQPSGAEAGQGSSGGGISSEKARALALAHAGLDSGQVVFVKDKLDYENGRQVYEVEFYTNDHKEYDYEIDVRTGEIVSYDYDAEGIGSSGAAGGGSITAEEAKALALAKVPGAGAGDIREFEADYDDGRLEYEGKIIYNGMEYEFEIDGANGMISSWEAEPASR